MANIIRKVTPKKSLHPQEHDAQVEKFPMRINKYLAFKKYSTRRGADEMVQKGQVLINGKMAVLGTKVLATDTVEVRFKGGKPAAFTYIAYSKPRGIATHDSEGFPAGVFPVTGLDKEAHGLVIFTNDGRLTDRLTSAAANYEKEYVVVSKNALRPSFKERAEAGMLVDGEETAPCTIKILNPNTFRIILNNEIKHQVRRMCAAVFQEVADIQCVRVMNIKLGKVKEGEQRRIDGEELKKFLKAVELA